MTLESHRNILGRVSLKKGAANNNEEPKKHLIPSTIMRYCAVTDPEERGEFESKTLRAMKILHKDPDNSQDSFAFLF